MGLDQYMYLRTLLPENERIEKIKEKYHYPLIRPKSLSDLYSHPRINDYVILDENLPREAYANIYLNINDEWEYDDDPLLDFHKPAYNLDEVQYFRKFNALQNYFEERYDIGNCEFHLITSEDIEDLLDIIEPIFKAYRLEDISKAQALAEANFPTTSGFFYGSLEYDDYYFQDIDTLYKTLLEMNALFPELNYNQDFAYYSWY